MPAKFSATLYIKSEDVETSSIVRNTIEGLLAAGCTYKMTHIPSTDNPNDDWMKRSWQLVKTIHDTQSLIQILSNDIEDVKKSNEKYHMPTRCYFDGAFEMDNEIRSSIERERTVFGETVPYLDIILTYNKEAKRIEIIGLIDEVYVSWMGGDGRMQQSNLKRFLQIVEAIYDKVGPFYGYLDYEGHDYNHISYFLVENKLPVDNFFVIIGKSHASGIQIPENVKSWKRLMDGGLFLQINHHPKSKSPVDAYIYFNTS